MVWKQLRPCGVLRRKEVCSEEVREWTRRRSDTRAPSYHVDGRSHVRAALSRTNSTLVLSKMFARWQINDGIHVVRIKKSGHGPPKCSQARENKSRHTTGITTACSNPQHTLQFSAIEKRNIPYTEKAYMQRSLYNASATRTRLVRTSWL